MPPLVLILELLTSMRLSCNIPCILEPYQHFVEIVSSKVAIENFECGHKKGKILNLTFGAHSIMGKSSLSLFLAFDAVQRFANHDLGMIISNFL